MKHLRDLKLSDFSIGLILFCLFVSLGVIFTINFKPLYDLDIKLLDITGHTGIEKEVLKSNYNTLIEYSSPFFKGNLSFPNFPSSKEGLQHFEEVKAIFNIVYYIFFISLPVSVILIFIKRKKREYGYLLATFIISIFFTTIVVISLLANFELSFEVFHLLLFNNDYWMFDPLLDPIITILPEQFFLHCGLLVIFVILLCSFTSYGIYHKRKVL